MCDESDPYTMPRYRIQLVHDGYVDATPLCSPVAVAAHLRDIALADREHMVCLFLDTKNRAVGRHLVSVGALNSSPVHSREVFKGAILANANAILLAHNHPSGDLTPSRCDDEITRVIVRVGLLLNIRLLDHVIVGPAGDFYSYRDHRPELLEEEQP